MAASWPRGGADKKGKKRPEEGEQRQRAQRAAFFVQRMKVACDKDREENVVGNPSLEKTKLIRELEEMSLQADLKDDLCKEHFLVRY